jgi:hypothetical protein
LHTAHVLSILPIIDRNPEYIGPSPSLIPDRNVFINTMRLNTLKKRVINWSYRSPLKATVIIMLIITIPLGLLGPVLASIIGGGFAGYVSKDTKRAVAYSISAVLLSGSFYTIFALVYAGLWTAFQHMDGGSFSFDTVFSTIGFFAIFGWYIILLMFAITIIFAAVSSAVISQYSE